MRENGRKIDGFIKSAVRLARDMGVDVCDCYSEWKKLALTVDVTMLLSNRINHQTSDMHELFADRLFDLIFKDKKEDLSDIADTVIKLL